MRRIMRTMIIHRRRTMIIHCRRTMITHNRRPALHNASWCGNHIERAGNPQPTTLGAMMPSTMPIGHFSPGIARCPASAAIDGLPTSMFAIRMPLRDTKSLTGLPNHAEGLQSEPRTIRGQLVMNMAGAVEYACPHRRSRVMRTHAETNSQLRLRPQRKEGNQCHQNYCFCLHCSSLSIASAHCAPSVHCDAAQGDFIHP